MDTIHLLPHSFPPLKLELSSNLGLRDLAHLRLNLSLILRGINPLKVGTLVNQLLFKLLQIIQLKSKPKWAFVPIFEIGMFMGLGV